jgi:spore coat protein CotH
MLERVFGTENGNLYKPDGTGARWTVFIAESFPKNTNQRDEDWTDVQDAIAALNESRANPQVWRSWLEARFAVSSFLRWLALNTIIGNTDTYGGFSPHNYWVYGSPGSGHICRWNVSRLETWTCCGTPR